MPEFEHRASELIIKHLQGGLSDEESNELLDWMDLSEKNRRLFRELTNEQTLRRDLARVESSKIKILDRLKGMIPALNKTLVYKLNWKYAAAVIIILIGAFYLFSGRQGKAEIAKTDHSPQIKSDVPAPTGSRTTLTLSNGSTLFLDSIKNGTLARQGNVNVSKLNGQLAYNALVNEEKNSTEVLFNTLSTARGGQTMIVLSDGSKVWLNAASTIRFPAVFTGRERKVEMTGEAYFEIAKSPNHPFRISVKNLSVQVLGTSFNVTAYDTIVQTTLLQGAVSVNRGQEEVLLKPGEQAEAGPEIRVMKNPDLESITAWKDQLFIFNNAKVRDVFESLSRWYGTEIKYDGQQSSKISAVLSRKASLATNLKIMNESGIRCEFDGKQIILLP